MDNIAAVVDEQILTDYTGVQFSNKDDLPVLLNNKLHWLNHMEDSCRFSDLQPMDLKYVLEKFGQANFRSESCESEERIALHYYLKGYCNEKTCFFSNTLVNSAAPAEFCTEICFSKEQTDFFIFNFEI
ncbi:hypothetical protein XELAEV_18001931mg [Xenopus laevis]|nr:hypothetical protein XELAEV_18001931mg [Xenopus laevis]